VSHVYGPNSITLNETLQTTANDRRITHPHLHKSSNSLLIPKYFPIKQEDKKNTHNQHRNIAKTRARLLTTPKIMSSGTP
jgi:SET domain-containing protein